MRKPRLLLGLLFLALAGLLLLACETAEAPEETVTPATATPPATPAGGAAITIDSPARGATVSVPLKVSGTASVFEATLSVAVRDAEGRVICEVTTTASEGAPGRGDYEVSFGFPPPEEETEAEVVAYSRSPKDGSIENMVTVPITLSPEVPPVLLVSPVCMQEVSSPVAVEGKASPGWTVEVMVGGLFGNELGRATLEADEQGSFSGEVEFRQIEQAQAGVVVASSAQAPGALFSVPVVLTR